MGDLAEVAVSLKVEFTVSRSPVSKEEGDYRHQGEFNTIRMEIPVLVVHVDPHANAEEEEEIEPESVVHTMRQHWANHGKGRQQDENSFNDKGILSDLKMLSLKLYDDLEK